MKIYTVMVSENSFIHYHKVFVSYNCAVEYMANITEELDQHYTKLDECENTWVDNNNNVARLVFYINEV